MCRVHVHQPVTNIWYKALTCICVRAWGVVLHVVSQLLLTTTLNHTTRHTVLRQQQHANHFPGA